MNEETSGENWRRKIGVARDIDGIGGEMVTWVF